MSITIADSTNDIVVSFLNDKGIVNIEKLTIPATAAASQGDYVVLTNAYGATLAAWLDLNANGTAPTGAAYAAATTKLKISIVTGGTAIVNAGIFAIALDVTAWANSATIVNNADGTVTVTQVIGATVAAADPHNTGDTGLGSITHTILTAGAATVVKRTDYIPKAGLKVLYYPRDGYLYMVTGENPNNRTTIDGRYKYSEITSPSTSSLTALVSLIHGWVSPLLDSEITGIANGEDVAVLSDTIDLVNFGWFQPTLSTGTVKYTTVDGDVVSRAYDLKETSLVRVRRIWVTGTTADMGIKIFY